MPGIVPPQLISVGQVLQDPSWRMPAHHHPFHELIAVLDGRLRVRFPGSDVVAGRGDVLLYPAGVEHAECADHRRGVRTVFISFSHPGVHAGLPRLVHDPGLRIAALLGWVHDLRHVRGPAAVHLHGSLAETALSIFRHLADYHEPEWVAQVRRYVREHLAEPLDVACLAAVAGLSRFHFARRYRRDAGCTPLADVRRLRAEAARDLIVAGDRPLREVAGAAGFANPHHLSRIMLQYLGVRPGSLRSRSPAPKLPLRVERHGRGNG